MSYIPPDPNEIKFNLKPYTAPASNSITFNLMKALGNLKVYIAGVWVGGKIKIFHISNWITAKLKSQVFPTNGLIAYWKMDEITGNVIDSVGSYGSSVFEVTRGIPGKLDNAYLFNGISDYIHIQTEALITELNYSIGGWVNLGDLMNFDGIIFSNRNNTGDLIIDSIGIRGGRFGWNYIATGEFREGGTQTLNLNEWYHFMFTSSGGRLGTIKLYINGIEDTITSTSFFRSGTTTRIGARHNGIFFNGLIDELGIWNRALTQQEVSYLYNNGAGNSLVLISE